MHTALVVEDLPVTRDWLVASVEAAFPGVQIETAGDMAAARRAIATARPELGLIDLGLPDGDGMDLIKALAGTGSYLVVTTVFADDAHLFPALQAGAHGYVLKDQSREQMVDLLQGIVRGQPPLSASIARRLLAHFGPAPQPAGDVHLSPREHETLRLIAKGFTVAQVAEALAISPNTTAGYVKEIYRKLNVSSRAEVAIEANRRGLLG